MLPRRQQRDKSSTTDDMEVSVRAGTISYGQIGPTTSGVIIKLLTVGRGLPC